MRVHIQIDDRGHGNAAGVAALLRATADLIESAPAARPPAWPPVSAHADETTLDASERAAAQARLSAFAAAHGLTIPALVDAARASLADGGRHRWLEVGS